MKYYLHDVPGRLRVRSPLLAGNQIKCREAEELLEYYTGVNSVEVKPITGSVTVEYDPRCTSSEELVEQLQLNGLFESDKAMSNQEFFQSTAAKAGEAVGKGIFGWAVGQAAQKAGLSFLAVLV
jgi:copper chaperone CopZ